MSTNIPPPARRVALAIGAHPDDIEFMMAGTLLLLKAAGAEIHMWNLANGYGGTAVHSREEIIRLRWEEAQASARVAGAGIYPPIADDLALFYELPYIQQVAAVVRRVQPDILLVPSLPDYMEDHQNACRLAVTGAFVRAIHTFVTIPPEDPWGGELALYHAEPYGLRDSLRRLVRAGQYVDIGPVLAVKRKMLAQHRSQKEWLDVSQGMDAYLTTMEEMSREAGTLSVAFTTPKAGAVTPISASPPARSTRCGSGWGSGAGWTWRCSGGSDDADSGFGGCPLIRGLYISR